MPNVVSSVVKAPGNPKIEGEQSTLLSIPFVGPKLISESELPNSEQRESFNRVIRRAHSQNDPIAIICAEIRCRTLGVWPKEYGKMMNGMRGATLALLEKPKDGEKRVIAFESAAKLLKGWRELASRQECTVKSDQLLSAREELLHLLTRNLKTETGKILAKCRLEIGKSKFEKIIGIKYSALWNRDCAAVVPEPRQFLDWIRKLSLLKDNAPTCISFASTREAWIADSIKRGRPELIARVVFALAERGLDLSDLRRSDIPKKYKIPTWVLTKLSHYEYVPNKFVPRLLKNLEHLGVKEFASRNSFVTTWKREAAMQPKQVVCKLNELLKAQKISSVDLASAFGLDDGRAKPALPVFLVLKYGKFCSEVPVGVMCYLAAKTTHEAQELIDLRRQELKAQWFRVGSNIDSPVAIERDIWSVSYSDLPFDRKELKKLETGGKAVLDQSQVLIEIKELGYQKCIKALSNLNEQSAANSVKSWLSKICERYGFDPIARGLRVDVAAVKLWAKGAAVPTLSSLQRLFSKYGGVSLTELELDWRNAVARCGILENLTDVNRVIRAIILEQASSRQAWATIKSTSFESSERTLRSIKNCGLPDKRGFALLKHTLEVERTSSRDLFISQVGLCGDIRQALKRWIGLIQSSKDHAKLQRSLNELTQDPVHVEPQKTPDLNQLMLTKQQIRGSLNSVPEDSEGSSVIHLMRQLPGVSVDELKQVINESADTRHELHLNAWKALSRAKISVPQLSYAIRKNDNTDRARISALQRSLSIKLTSPICPLGILKVISAPNVEVAIESVEKCKEVLSQYFSGLGISPNEISISMAIWGVGIEDLKFNKHEVLNAIYDPNYNQESKGLILAQIERIGWRKACKTLERISDYHASVTTAECFKRGLIAIASQARKMCHEVGFQPGSTAQYIAGDAFPSFKKWGDFLGFVGMELNFDREVEWYFNLATHNFKSMAKSPIARFVAAQRAWVSGPRPKILKTTITRALTGKTFADESFNKCIKALELKETSRELAAHFLSNLNKENSYPRALCSLLKEREDNKSLLYGVKQLISSAKKYDLVKIDADTGSDATFEKTFSRWATLKLSSQAPKENQTAAIELLKVFAGITPSELLQVEALCAMESPKQPTTPRINPQQFERLDFEQRVRKLRTALNLGYEVPNSTLEGIFSDVRGVNSLLMRRNFGPAWLLASLDIFKEPKEALNELISAIDKGHYIKHTGVDAYKSFVDLAQRRGECRVLESFSMRLLFDDYE